MKTIYSKALLVAILVTFWAGGGFAQHWSYTGEAGPENGAKLDAKFAVCGEGRNQSPIDLSDLMRRISSRSSSNTRAEQPTLSTTGTPSR